MYCSIYGELANYAGECVAQGVQPTMIAVLRVHGGSLSLDLNVQRTPMRPIGGPHVDRSVDVTET